MIENISKEILENRKNISSIHIILIILLLTVDYYSILSYDIELKNLKYLINYQELLVINTTIIGIGILLSILSNKMPIQFFISLFTILTIVYFNTDNNFNKSIEEILYLTIVIFFIIYGFEKLYKYFIDTFSQHIKDWTLIFLILFFTILATIFIYNHYKNLNTNWENIYIENDEYTFKKYDLFEILLKQKIFSTNKLEKLQTDITFQNSEMYINELKELNVLTDNILKYDNNTLFSNYLTNEEYKTFFIVKKAEDNSSKNIKMLIIFSKKNKDKEEYQINNIQEKELKIINNE